MGTTSICHMAMHGIALRSGINAVRALDGRSDRRFRPSCNQTHRLASDPDNRSPHNARRIADKSARRNPGIRCNQAERRLFATSSGREIHKELLADFELTADISRHKTKFN
jgi:hypothetical protein